MGLTEFYSTLFSALFLYFCKTKNNHVLPPSHPSHHLPAFGGDRPRLRLDAYRVPAHALRLGAGCHRGTDYPEQEYQQQVTPFRITSQRRF